MSNDEPDSRVDQDRQILTEAHSKGFFATLLAYTRLSGPGWLQSAITLGGGSLASSLILGILAGYTMLWLQPLAMILGIVMLGAIGYVTLSTGRRPFDLINEEVNPVLGWGWALAAGAANIVWCLPQYALAYGAVSENLLPKYLGDSDPSEEVHSQFVEQAIQSIGQSNWFTLNIDKLVIVIFILLISILVTWQYDRDRRGIKFFEAILKVMVGLIVAAFVGVVCVLTYSGQLPWNEIGNGFIPNFRSFVEPATTLKPYLDAITNQAAREYWSDLIVSKQQDVMIGAAATAVGINMTFLFPYSLLRKGWTKEFRSLAVFDLAFGMFIPFIVATTCVVIASASCFHGKVTEEFGDKPVVIPDGSVKVEFDKLIGARNTFADEKKLDLTSEELGTITEPERRLAAMLVERKSSQLSNSLSGLAGSTVGNAIFGFGVLAMTISTIMMLMLISGFTLTELLGCRPGGWVHRIGTLISGIGGAFGPFIWKDAAAYLAVPTSVFGYMLLPLAYVTFFLLMNQRSVLGDAAPRPLAKAIWNLLMFVAASVATIGSVYIIWTKTNISGLIAVCALVGLTLMVQVNRHNKRKRNNQQ
jgi:Mn2+/Fe2+ NRAMP family transporter